MKTARDPQTTFRWYKDAVGYSLFPDGTIRRNGGALQPYEPAKDYPRLHLDFAELLPLAFLSDYKQGDGLIPTGEGPPPLPRDFQPGPALLDFVNKYGFLGSDRWGANAESESVDYLVRSWREIAGILRLGALIGGKQLLELNRKPLVGPNLRMSLELDEAERTVVKYRPESLVAWMWLRVADSLTSGARWDGAPFLYCGSPIGRGPKARRTHAKFCSKNCKTYFNRLPPAEQEERTAKALAARREQMGETAT